IRDMVTSRFNQMQVRSKRAAGRTARDVAANIGALSNVVSLQMGDMIDGVNAFLDVLGIGKIKKPSAKKVKNFLSMVQEVASNDPSLDTKAAGGWIGRAG